MNILLSKNNHFEFGYNGEPFNFRTSPEDQWFARYGKCERKTESFRKECLQTARDISAVADGKVSVLFSGGVDSEAALRSFVRADQPVQAAILKFKNGLNEHDISYAVTACEELG